jgi:ElaB/YqjD/DUF883 family membrane-anchored ribosome-binding protein
MASTTPNSSSTPSSPYPTTPPTSTTSTVPGGNAASGDKTVERVVQGAHDAVDRIAEKAVPAVEKLRAGVNQAADTLQSQADQLSEMQKQWVESARTCVRDHPFASVAVAVAAGMLLGRLLSSRS